MFSLNNVNISDLFTIGMILFVVVCVILYQILKSPFGYPYKTIYFDVSGKRKPQVDELVDEYMIYYGFSEFENYKRLVEEWKYNCQGKINKSLLKKEGNDSLKHVLMTPKLKRLIMERDNFTCQMCGKYMPDTVGLEIDHIFPVSRGGKTVASNLQVLCSKCNRRKSNKI